MFIEIYIKKIWKGELIKLERSTIFTYYKVSTTTYLNPNSMHKTLVCPKLNNFMRCSKVIWKREAPV